MQQAEVYKTDILCKKESLYEQEVCMHILGSQGKGYLQKAICFWLEFYSASNTFSLCFWEPNLTNSPHHPLPSIWYVDGILSDSRFP